MGPKVFNIIFIFFKILLPIETACTFFFASWCKFRQSIRAAIVIVTIPVIPVIPGFQSFRFSASPDHTGFSIIPVLPFIPVAKFIAPDWGYKVNSVIGLSYRPARLHRLAGQYDNLMP